MPDSATDDPRSEALRLTRRALGAAGTPILARLWDRLEATDVSRVATGMCWVPGVLAVWMLHLYLGWYAAWAFEQASTWVEEQEPERNSPP